MRDLSFLISDVREATDNTDINGVKDKEIIRYFQDAVKSVQALIFKNNPLCSYFQNSTTFGPPVTGKVFTLPTDVYGDNAVSFVETQSDDTQSDSWCPLERVWQEDQNSFLGWYTRNKSIVFSGSEDVNSFTSARVWYFQRLPRWDKVWATVASKAGQVITLTVGDADLFTVDSFISILTSEGVEKLAGLKFSKTTDTTITVVGNITSVVAGDQIVMGKNTTLSINLPEEVETYIVEYVCKKVASRNVYTTEANSFGGFSADAKADIIAIFADVGQAQVRAPITDTDYMGI